jgi:hypothetical protein
MSIAGSIEALLEEALIMLDREAEFELRAIGREFLQWLEKMVPLMPCDNWRYEFDRFIAKLAREHVIVAKESCREWIQWLQDANDAARLDGRQPGSPCPVQFCTWEGKYDPPKVTSNKPAPFDPDYPQLRGTGNAIMEHNPPDDWVELAQSTLQSYRVPQEIKDAFVGWLEDEQRKGLGFELPPGTLVLADGQPYAVCFSAGTLVVTQRGMTRIEAVNCGDKVLAVADGAPHGKPEWCEVLQTYHNHPARLIEIQIDHQAVTRVSHGHPWYVVGRGWISTSGLQIGDELITAIGGRATVTGTRLLPAAEPVYNLRVDRCHTYFVAGDDGGPCVLVHNESPADGDATPPNRLPRSKGHWKNPAAAGNSDWILDEPVKLEDGRVVTSVRYDNKLPVLDDFSHGKDVYIAISGDDKFDRAEALVKWKRDNPGMRVPEGYTFHHDLRDVERITLADGSTVLYGRMQLVPSDLNAVPHVGSASFARRFGKVEGVSDADRVATARKINSELLSGTGGVAEARKAAAKIAKGGKAVRTVMKVGRRMIPIVGGMITLITFKQDAEAHGIAGATLRATPLLGDFLAAYDVGNQMAQNIIANTDKSQGRTALAYKVANQHAESGAAMAQRQTADAFNRIAQKVKVAVPYIDEDTVNRLESAMRAYNGRVYQINSQLLMHKLPPGQYEGLLQQAEDDLRNEVERAVQVPGSQKDPT